MAADSEEGANPYAVIAERNVFHLNPPPPPPSVEDTAPKADLPVIKITGIAEISGKVRAFFVTQPKDPKEPPTYFSLAEGEREGILEVVRIYAAEQKIDIVNSGKAETLTFKDDALAKNEGTPPPGAARAAGGGPQKTPPAVPAMPEGGIRRHVPPAFPSGVGPRPGGAPFQFPTRARRTTPGGAVPTTGQ